MEFQSATIIRANEKDGIKTARSEYIFHLTAYPAQQTLGFYEGIYPNTQLEYNTHYHKKMTEIFTVLEGEFSFMLNDKPHTFCTGDTVIIPPMSPHGFRPQQPGSRLQFIFTGVANRNEFFKGLEKLANGELQFNAEEREAWFNSHDQYHI